MHITMVFNSLESRILKVPLSNLHLFQSLLYKLLPAEYGSFLHNEGYIVDGHPMKLFAMSWPSSLKHPKFSENFIEFEFPVRLTVSTPVLSTLDGMASGALLNEKLRIGANTVICEKIDVRQMAVTSEKITVRTLSPITCYTQMLRQDGRKYTVYFAPGEKDFKESVHNNLVRKFRALYPDEELPQGQVQIAACGVPLARAAKFISGNSFPIKGWDGRFTLSGPQKLLQVGLDCGLGAKNSGGWGCVELVSEEKGKKE